MEDTEEKYKPENIWKFIQELGEKLKKTDEIVNGIAKSNGDMLPKTRFIIL